jgi:hypothetical protein
MNSIASLLKRYLNFTPPSLVRARAIQKVLLERFGAECSDGDIVVRGDVAHIRVSGSLKSEIAIHKTELLARINELGGGTLADIR